MKRKVEEEGGDYKVGLVDVVSERYHIVGFVHDVSSSSMSGRAIPPSRSP